MNTRHTKTISTLVAAIFISGFGASASATEADTLGSCTDTASSDSGSDIDQVVASRKRQMALDYVALAAARAR